MTTTFVYLAGPMRHQPEFNFPAFDAAADDLRARGHVVFSPAEHDRKGGFDPAGLTGHEDLASLGFDLAAALAWDLHTICVDAHAVVVLPGWEQSSGTLHEIATARMVGLPVLAYPHLVPIDETAARPGAPPARESILEEAQRIIHGDRHEDYGHPADDFTRTGRIWGAILGIDDVPPELVGLCMVGVKISREVNHPKRDNRTDGAGYFGTVDMVHERRDREAP